MPKKIDLRQKFIRSTVAVALDDTITISVVGKWNLMALEAKFAGPPCLGTAWFEPVVKTGAWASTTAVGLCKNSHFCSASNLLWHGRLPLQDNRINKIIVGLRDGENGHLFSLSILLEEK